MNLVEKARRSLAQSNQTISPPLQAVLGAAAVTAVLWMTALNPVAPIQIVASFVILLFAWWSYANWRRGGCVGLPLYAMVTAMYWVYFGLQLYWGDLHIQDWRHPNRQVTEAAATETMLLVVFGLIFLRIGFGCGLGRRFALRQLPELAPKTTTIPYVEALTLFALAFGYSGIAFDIRAGLDLVFDILTGTVPLVALGILLGRMIDGKASYFDKLFLVGLMGVGVILGISSGWLGRVVNLGLVGALTFLRKKNKLPVVAFLVLIPYVLFFQVGKNTFRRTYWYGQTEGSSIERIGFWMEVSLQQWQAVFNEPSVAMFREVTSGTLSRTALLSQTANVIEQTPDPVPFQYGRTYSYLASFLIPRFIWPDKPSMNEANQFYQVAYGLTKERDLMMVSIAVGALTEGYINFGWYGVALIMFLIGVLLEFWNETFFVNRNLTVAAAIGIALMPQLLAPEAQLAQLVTGLGQTVLVCFAVFVPVMKWPKKAAGKKLAGGGLRLAQPLERRPMSTGSGTV